MLKNPEEKKWLLLTGAGEILLVCIVSSPWLYITMQNIGKLGIAAGNVLYNIGGYLGSNYIGRLMPVPFDARSLRDGINVSTPWLDLQVNVPMFILYLFSVAGVLRGKEIPPKYKYRSVIIFVLVLFSLVCCTSSGFSQYSIVVFKYIQWLYRLITYFDLMVLAGTIYNTFILAKNGRLREFEKRVEILLVVCVTLSSHNLLIQWIHANTTANLAVVEEGDVQILPETFYGIDAYIDRSVKSIDEAELSEKNTMEVPVSVSRGGSVNGSSFFSDKETFIVTNIQAANYNKVILDGRMLDMRGELFNFEGAFGFYVSSGKHQIDYVQELPKAYLALRKGSYAAFALLILLNVLLAQRRVRLGRNSFDREYKNK